MQNVDPNSWLYSALQATEQLSRAIEQMSPEELKEIEGTIDHIAFKVKDLQHGKAQPNRR